MQGNIQMLACDYDGTLAEHGKMNAMTEQALHDVKQAGLFLGLVTGRLLDDLMQVCPQVPLFDIVIAENGAVLYQPSSGETVDLGPSPSAEFCTALDQRGVDYAVGRVLVNTFRPYSDAVREAIQTSNCDLEMILNNEALMILPRGVDKASGLQVGVERLGITVDAVAAVGDAENDVAFLRAAGLGVAVANAIDELKREADIVTEGVAGVGVVEFVEKHLLGS